MTSPYSISRRRALIGMAAIAASGLPLLARAKTTLKVGHISAIDHPWHQALTGMAKEISEKTNGEVVLQIYPSSQLGGEQEMAQSIGLHVLDMGLFGTGALQALDRRLIIEELPYAWPSREAAYKALDGKLGDALAKILTNYNMTTLSWWESGYRHTTNSRRPINAVADFEGLKLRVPQADMRIDTFNILGALSTPLPFSEVFGALQQKVVDGQENPLSTIYASKFYEVQPHLALTKHIWGSAVLVIASDKWAKLTSDQQRIFNEAAQHWKLEERSMITVMDEKALDAMKTAGIQITQPDTKAFKAAEQPIWEKYTPRFGQELMGIVHQYAA